MNRRRFLAAIGAAALARSSIAVGAVPIATAPKAVPMMADLIGGFFHLHPPGSDPRKFKRNFEKMCRLVIQTGPLVLKGYVWSARREGNSYVLTQSDKPFIEHRFPIDVSPITLFSLGLPDEQLSMVTGIPLASRTPVPAWAFRTL